MTRLINTVKELRNKLMGYEMELNILEADYIELSKEIRHLFHLEEQLVYNINFLRQDGVVAVAEKYGKSVKQLEEVRKRITKNIGLKSAVGNKMRDVSINYDYYKDKFDKAFRQLENEQVILMFNPDKKRLNNNECKGKKDSEREDS